VNLKTTEKVSDSPLACFNIMDQKYFHTGDMNMCVIPDTNMEFNKQTYAHIRFHLFLQTIPKMNFLLVKNSKNPTSYLESTFTTLIEFSQPFTYEYIESYVTSLCSTQLQLSIVDLRFYKMEMVKASKDSFELIYFLLGTVEISEDLLSLQNFSILTHDQVMGKIQPFKYWREILASGEFPSGEISSHFHTGLIIGRFQPLHLGHTFLFKKALEIVDFLKIGVGSSQINNESKNPFSYDERKSLIENALKEEKIPASRFEIFAIPDLFNFSKWINSIFDIVDNFDVLFTNNLWIGRLIQKRGKTLVYGMKNNFAIYNGTYIRELLKSNNIEWKTLVPNSTIPFLENWIAKK
jgi:nicotinamide-nucleotide adenylyltransferase